MISQNFKTFLIGLCWWILGALLVVVFSENILSKQNVWMSSTFSTQSVEGNPSLPTTNDLPPQYDGLEWEWESEIDPNIEENIEMAVSQQLSDQITASEKAVLQAELREINEITNNPELANRMNEPFITTCWEWEITTECVVAWCTATDIPQAECEALLDLYTSTNGKNWENTIANNNKWFGNNSACSWYGITCEGWHVSILNLYGNNLAGTIPASISKLASLKQFRLSNNNLNWSLPSSLGDLKNLEFLFVYANKLSGPIPDALGNISSLTQLLLNNNQLSGPLPSSLGAKNVQWIDVHENNLSGPLPESLSKKNNVRLDASYNQFSGPIPSSYGSAKWKNLYLKNNQLCGKLPKSFMISQPNGIKYWYSVYNNKLVTSNYEPDMTTWLKNTKFYFGAQNSSDCDSWWDDSEQISTPDDK